MSRKGKNKRKARKVRAKAAKQFTIDENWFGDDAELEATPVPVEEYYFAYGSNLNVPQMSVRCPNAEPVANAKLKDWGLVFRGVADVVPMDGKTVYGVIWKITDQCLRALDRYEGYPTMYDRKVVDVQLEDGSTVKAITYYMVNDRSLYPPMGGYYECIVEGFEHFGLPLEQLKYATVRSLKAGDNRTYTTDKLKKGKAKSGVLKPTGKKIPSWKGKTQPPKQQGMTVEEAKEWHKANEAKRKKILAKVAERNKKRHEGVLTETELKTLKTKGKSYTRGVLQVKYHKQPKLMRQKLNALHAQ